MKTIDPADTETLTAQLAVPHNQCLPGRQNQHPNIPLIPLPRRSFQNEETFLHENQAITSHRECGERHYHLERRSSFSPRSLACNQTNPAGMTGCNYHHNYTNQRNNSTLESPCYAAHRPSCSEMSSDDHYESCEWISQSQRCSICSSTERAWEADRHSTGSPRLKDSHRCSCSPCNGCRKLSRTPTVPCVTSHRVCTNHKRDGPVTAEVHSYVSTYPCYDPGCTASENYATTKKVQQEETQGWNNRSCVEKTLIVSSPAPPALQQQGNFVCTSGTGARDALPVSRVVQRPYLVRRQQRPRPLLMSGVPVVIPVSSVQYAVAPQLTSVTMPSTAHFLT